MSDGPGLILGRWPGVVSSYNPATRECTVLVPGMTNGAAAEYPAEISYPVGDKSKAGEFSTDILMLPGDDVWLEFIGGDSRYPVIVGQRNAKIGNGTGWRRLHQANMELLATHVMNLIAGGVITIKSDVLVKIDAPETQTTGNLTVGGGLSVEGGGGKASSINGSFAIQGDELTHNGSNIGSTHTHKEQGDGADVSPPH